MTTVLVAGGAGFIGSHVVEKLLAKSYRVICVDNLISGSKENVQPLLENEHFTFIEADIIDSKIISHPQLSGVNYIFHLASPASPNEHSPRSYINNPIKTLQVNSIGTQNLLEIAKKNTSRLVFASTSEVYGDPHVSPQTEEYWGNVNPNGIRSVYDEGKRYGEAMVMAYVRSFHVDARIVRIFNTYGPCMQPDDGRVVSNFITQAISGHPITVYGKGEQTRSFCYVSDMVEGLMNVMFADSITGEVINLGNPIERTILEFATLIKEMTHSSSEIIFEDLPADDPKKRRPDISKAKRFLGWEPVVGLEEGLAKTIEYFKRVRQ